MPSPLANASSARCRVAAGLPNGSRLADSCLFRTLPLAFDALRTASSLLRLSCSRLALRCPWA